MRTRIISIVVVLGLGIVAISFAQQAGNQAKQLPNDKEKLRDNVIKLRVEIELLQLDQDADRANLLELIKCFRNYEDQSPEQKRQAVEMSRIIGGEFAERESSRDSAIQKKIDGLFTEGLDSEQFQKRSDELYREKKEETRRDIDQTIKKQGNDAKSLIDRRKSEFAKRAVELIEKRLNLEDVERRYNTVR